MFRFQPWNRIIDSEKLYGIAVQFFMKHIHAKDNFTIKIRRVSEYESKGSLYVEFLIQTSERGSYDANDVEEFFDRMGQKQDDIYSEVRDINRKIPEPDKDDRYELD